MTIFYLDDPTQGGDPDWLRPQAEPITELAYDPGQPRVPAGSSEGGQWAGGPGGPVSGGTRAYSGSAAAETERVAALARRGVDPSEFDGPIMSRGVAITVSDELKRRLDTELYRGGDPSHPEEFNSHLELGPIVAEQLLGFEGHQGVDRLGGFGQSWTTRESVAESVSAGHGQNLVVKVVARPRQSDVIIQEVDTPDGRTQWVDAAGAPRELGGESDLVGGEMEVRIHGKSPVDIIDIQVSTGSGQWASIWGDERGFGAGADELYRQFPHLLEEMSVETFRFNPSQPRDENGMWTSTGGGRSVGSIADVDKYLADNPQLPDEPIFVWHGRLVDGLDPTTKHALLFEIRERPEVVPFIADGMRRWREQQGLPEPEVDIGTIPADQAKSYCVARVFETTPDMSNDPVVAAAYENFHGQSEAMFEFMTRPESEGGMGVTVEFWTDPNPANFGNGPYANATEQADDLRNNRRIKLESGLGGDHTSLTREQYDRFRAVHDVFGHAGIGSGFDRHGEYQAYLAHASMYTGTGRDAMASEYHGVNSAAWSGEPGSPGTGKSVLLPPVLIANPWDNTGTLLPVPDEDVLSQFLPDPDVLERFAMVASGASRTALGITSETEEAIAYLVEQTGMGPRVAQSYDENGGFHHHTPLDALVAAAAGITVFRYNPNQPRADDGTWTSTGAAAAPLSAPDSGFTVGVTNLKPVTSGFAVALGGTDRLVVAADAFDSNGRPNEQLKRLVRDRIDAAHATPIPEGTTLALGAWHNPADGKIEVNVTAVFPADQRDAALAYAQAQDQIAMANLNAITAGDWDNAIIDTGGTGGARDTDLAAVLDRGQVRVVRLGYDPSQPRAEDGKWTDGPGGSAGGAEPPAMGSYVRRDQFPALTGEQEVFDATSRWSDPGSSGGPVFDSSGNLPYVEMTSIANRAADGREIKVDANSIAAVGLLNGMPDAPKTEVPHYRALAHDYDERQGISALTSATPDLSLTVEAYLPGRGRGAMIRFEPGTPHREALAGSWGQTVESIVSGKFKVTRVEPNDLTEDELSATYNVTTGEYTPLYSAVWEDFA